MNMYELCILEQIMLLILPVLKNDTNCVVNAPTVNEVILCGILLLAG